jgi:signal transduction histidine kinase
LIVDSRLTPVEPAVMAMKYQILYISLIVIIIAIIVAILLSRTISKPIITINDSAKKMAEGNLDVEFNGRGYKEITELNNTLNHTVEELKKTETLQRELLANVSHDLRTPLTLISGYAEMMKDIPEEKTEENIQIIVDETKRLSMLVNDLLSLSRIKSRTEELNLTKFDLKELLVNIIDRQNKFFENINAKINLLTSVDKVYVKADISKIEQVMYNFITNAINYSKDNKIVDVILEVNNDLATIKVRDYGIGIKEENLEFIWQRYYRVDKGLKRSTQGTGLGLSIIKEILEYHGFKYGVESQENVGSTFYFELPIELN